MPTESQTSSYTFIEIANLKKKEERDRVCMFPLKTLEYHVCVQTN